MPGVPFAMAARARRVVAECPPWVRHWRSCKRTRRMKIRESELGGAAPKVCSQTRRRLAKSKPSRTTFRPTPVSCGITERSLLCSIKSSLMTDFRMRSSLPAARPTADLSQPCVPPVSLSLATRSPGVVSQSCGAKHPRFCADSKGVEAADLWSISKGLSFGTGRGTTRSFSSTLLCRWPGSDRVQNLHRDEHEFAGPQLPWLSARQYAIFSFADHNRTGIKN